jgi:hypothetical protein
MSIANAMSVNKAARKEAIEARSVTVKCVERESMKAMKATAAADYHCSLFEQQSIDDEQEQRYDGRIEKGAKSVFD